MNRDRIKINWKFDRSPETRIAVTGAEGAAWLLGTRSTLEVSVAVGDAHDQRHNW